MFLSAQNADAECFASQAYKGCIHCHTQLTYVFLQILICLLTELCKDLANRF